MILSEVMEMELRRLEEVTDTLSDYKGEPGTALYSQLMSAIGQIQSGMSCVKKAKAILEAQEESNG